jgi:hypothetical protein
MLVKFEEKNSDFSTGTPIVSYIYLFSILFMRKVPSISGYVQQKSRFIFYTKNPQALVSYIYLFTIYDKFRE